MAIKEGLAYLKNLSFLKWGQDNTAAKGAGLDVAGNVDSSIVVPIAGAVDSESRINAALVAQKKNDQVYIGPAKETVITHRNHVDCILDKEGKLSDIKLFSIYESTYGVIKCGNTEVLRDEKLSLFKAAVKDYIKPSTYLKLQKDVNGKTSFDKRTFAQTAYENSQAMSRYNNPGKLNEIITNIANGVTRPSTLWGAKNYGFLLDYILKDLIPAKVDRSNSKQNVLITLASKVGSKEKVDYGQLNRGTIDSKVLFNFIQKLKGFQEAIYS